MRRCALALLLLAGCPAPPPPPPPALELTLATPRPDFARALAPRELHFPEDHGPHEEFQTEWWYWTGNLAAADGRRYGFQLTFFRRGLSPGRLAAEGLATNQIYLAHFAITDVAAGRHAFAERSARGAAGLAGAQAAPLAVWLLDWRADGLDGPGHAVRLQARDGALLLDVTLRPGKPPVLQGDRGLSAKSAEPGNASYYVSLTRLGAQGRIGTASGEAAVSGSAWFDHEWSTSALGRGAVGWDWFSLQLSDRRELMLFQLRREDGSLEPVSGGTLVEPDGSTRRIALSDFKLQPAGTWRSPSGAAYPARWTLKVADLDLEIAPLLADQELKASFTYWEGAVAVAGRSATGPVSGQGYVELTGYARSMAGVF
jgi:predicted secreted hydrolase